MTIFSDNPHDRRMERLMMTVPNFAPRGVGFRFTEAQLFITTTAATPTEILTATMRRVYAYLLNRRGIDREVLSAFVHKGMIYESTDYHNAVFVGYDEHGICFRLFSWIKPPSRISPWGLLYFTERTFCPTAWLTVHSPTSRVALDFFN